MSEKRFIEEAVNLEERSLQDGSKASYIVGSGIVFEKWSKQLRAKTNTGEIITFIEKVERRSVEGVDMSDIESMVDHTFILGKRNKGTMDITIDDTAVRYSVLVPNTTVGSDAKENIRNGNLSGSSFKFNIAPKGDSWDKSSIPYKRTIHKFSEIEEMGPVSKPAYPDTTAAMRSLEESEAETVEPTPKTDFKRFENLFNAYKATQK